jgi:hypothetical protein
VETTELLKQATSLLRDVPGETERQLANWLEHMAGLLGRQRYQNESPPGKNYAIAVAQAVLEEYGET